MKVWSTLSIKSLDEERRIISGIASTPSTDRAGDVVEPMGAKFSLPLPFLWQHNSEQPVGQVTSATPTKNGIPVTIELARVDEPGVLKDRLDEVWQSIKAKLVRGLSIGFQPLEYSFLDSGGVHHKTWNWLELSGVTIPCNQEATIQTVKRFDSPEVAEKELLRAKMRAITKRWDDYDVKNGRDIKSPATIHQMNANCARVLVDSIDSAVEMAQETFGEPLLERIEALEAEIAWLKHQ